MEHIFPSSLTSITLSTADFQSLFEAAVNNRAKELLEEYKSTLKIPAQDETMTRKEVMPFLDVDSSTLWRWNQAGYLVAYKVGGRTMYKTKEVMAINSGER